MQVTMCDKCRKAEAAVRLSKIEPYENNPYALQSQAAAQLGQQNRPAELCLPCLKEQVNGG